MNQEFADRLARHAFRLEEWNRDTEVVIGLIERWHERLDADPQTVKGRVRADEHHAMREVRS